MTVAQLIPLVLKFSIGLNVFSLALRAQRGDLTFLFRRPSLLVRSMFAMNVVMPVLAVLTASLFHLRPELKVALVLLSVAPVPPVLPGKQTKAGGDSSYAMGLLLFAALVSIVTIPVSVALIGRLFGSDVRVPLSLIATTVGATVVAPLLLGTLVRRLAPSFAARFAGPLSKIGTVLLILAFVPILIGSMPAITAAIGDFSVLAIALFLAAGLVVGHLLGGPHDDDRTVLALATASRHPGVAMALAGAIAPPEARTSLTATVLLAVLVGMVVTGPYSKWRRRSHPAVAGAPAIQG
jgi:BASS family bile acid:Na+ symporter